MGTRGEQLAVSPFSARSWAPEVCCRIPVPSRNCQGMRALEGSFTGEDTAQLLEFLSLIERREAALLTWGLVDAAFSRDELESLALDFLDGCPALARFAPGELVDQLFDRHLLHRFNRAGATQFRSRMAETVRLLARLRQIFRTQPWQAGRPLVADYRLVIRPRERPVRNVSPEALLEHLTTAGVDLPATRRDGLRAYLSSPDQTALQLASFQRFATEEIFRRLDGGHPAGCVVSAGTGSGKTHAFYLPAMVHLAELIDAAGTPWTKALAIYPRNELLKDQLSNAFANARKLDGLLQRRGRRPLTLGAWYGQTPTHSRYEPNWLKGNGGHLCPFLTCPACSADLVWKDGDRQAGDEILRCTACSVTIGPEQFVFTRQAMLDSPPDLLFTTTESLNRQLASKRNAHVFGSGATHRPRLCLLDEIHTYEGVHGAQVALLLRRWRHAAGQKTVFVGLSATLENPVAFMSDLTGLPESQIVAVPTPDEQLARSGMEYLIALRHDPGSGTAVLSTTIQAAMLMARMIDSPAARNGVSGQRVFVFTDRLDSVNRLYWDLIDAEGWFVPGSPLRNRTPLALATIRAPDTDATPTAADRRRGAGQSWDMAQRMGHDLVNDRQLGIGRTTSQDVGVNARAEVVVATASLEVGYDDDKVGVVIQHKAPHDAARFIQRKGRAGRRAEMRPWSIVILTDLGRDRITYQSYDQLFSPRLNPNRLPVRNRYVLRIQAVYSTLDWLGKRLSVPGDWRQFGSPATTAHDKARQAAAAIEIRRVLEDEGTRRVLERHLGAALRLSPEDLRAVLWEPPRALMTAVLPTLLRRLETAWADEPVEAGSSPPPTPLPEFMPPSLFSELLLPEVAVHAPVPRGQPEQEMRGVGAAMGELWIGNVSRRYAVKDRRVRHWAQPPPAPESGAPDVVVLDDYQCYDCDPAGTFHYWDGEAVLPLAGFRLRSVRLEIVPDAVKDSSRGQPVWSSNLTPSGFGRQLPVPPGTGWEGHLVAAHAFLHRDGSAVAVDRFARGSVITESTQTGKTTRRLALATRSGDGPVPAGVGFGFEADGLRISVPDLAGGLDLAMDPAWLRRSRAAYLYRRFEDGAGFPDDVDVFARHWLRLALLATAIEERSPGEPGLGPALQRLSNTGLGTRLVAALDVMFETIAAPDAEGDTGDTGLARRGDTHAALARLCQRPEVVSAVQEHAGVLTDVPDTDWLAWEARRLRSTLGAAVIHAAAELCPDVNPDDLVVDVDPVPGDLPAAGSAAIWLTETAPGGSGVLERIVDAWRDDPVRFLRIMRRALDPSDFERLDEDLSAVLALAGDADEVTAGFARVRTAWRSGHAAVMEAVAGLRDHLARSGVVLTRQVLVALNTRVLSPGSSRRSDDVMREMLDTWAAHEEEAGVELESRLVAFLLAGDDRFDDGLGLERSADGVTQERRYDVLANLLWPRGGDLRLVSLMAPNPYAAVDHGDRRGLASLLSAGPATVALSEPDAHDRVAVALQNDGHVVLEASASRTAELRAALLDLAVNAVDSGFLLSYPRVSACDRVDGAFRVLLELAEVKT